jgi:hypothetical protein
MRRKLFTLAAGASGVVCIAVCWLWVRSYLHERLWVKWMDGRLVVVGADGNDATRLGKYYLDPPPDGALGFRLLVLRLRTGVAPFAASLPPPMPPAQYRGRPIPAIPPRAPPHSESKCSPSSPTPLAAKGTT